MTVSDNKPSYKRGESTRKQKRNTPPRAKKRHPTREGRPGDSVDLCHHTGKAASTVRTAESAGHDGPRPARSQVPTASPGSSSSSSSPPLLLLAPSTAAAPLSFSTFRVDNPLDPPPPNPTRPDPSATPETPSETLLPLPPPGPG